jgi:HSP20 family protein
MARYVQLRWMGGAGLPGSPFSQTSGGTWQPSLNAYRCERCIKVCFDLAGVDKERIDIQIEPGRLVVRGVRKAPEPASGEPLPQQILAMEIDHGPFVRELRLPAEVLRDEVTAEHRNGLLWINLPLRHD